MLKEQTLYYYKTDEINGSTFLPLSSERTGLPVYIQIDNWCLSKYCQIYDAQNKNYNHWIIELRAHMENIKSLNIKQGDKLKTLKKMLIYDYDFDDVSTIHRIIIGKFHRENITNVNVISFICNEFTYSVGAFIDTLGIDSIITDNYLKYTFNLQD